MRSRRHGSALQVAVRHTACYAYHNLAVEQYRLGALPTMPCNVNNSAAMAALQRCRCSRAPETPAMLKTYIMLVMLRWVGVHHGAVGPSV